MNTNIISDLSFFIKKHKYIVTKIYFGLYHYSKYIFKIDNNNILKIIKTNNVFLYFNAVDEKHLLKLLNSRIVRLNYNLVKSITIKFPNLEESEYDCCEYRTEKTSYDFSKFSNLCELNCLELKILKPETISKNIKSIKYIFSWIDFLDLNIDTRIFKNLIFLELQNVYIDNLEILNSKNLKHLILNKINNKLSFKTFKDLKSLIIIDCNIYNNYKIDHFINKLILSSTKQLFLKKDFYLNIDLNYKIRDLYLSPKILKCFDSTKNLKNLNCKNLFICK